MTKFILRRVVRGVVALFVFQSLLFLLIQALPYDFSVMFLAPPAWRAMVRRELGLDLPIWQQYVRWVWGFVRLDLGESFLFWPTPVSTLLLNRLPRTLVLFLSASILAYMLGVWLGKMMAWHRGGIFEIGATLGGVATYTSFAPWLGFVMINVFGWELGWLPYRRLVDHNVWFDAPVSVDWMLTWLIVTAVLVGGAWFLTWRFTRPLQSRRWRWAARLSSLTVIGLITWLAWRASGVGHLAVDILRHLILPLGTVVLLSFGETMMIMRTSMLDTLQEDYVLMARAKGLPDRVVRNHHAARNAILPVIARLMINLPFVLVGSLVIERVFLWHAMGHMIFTAIEYQDIPLLMGILSMVGMLVLILHVLLDIVALYLDPRLRYQAAE